jgi:glycosyltransferase involved in cell wall biosynthesis
MGFAAHPFSGVRDFAGQLRHHLADARRLAFFATGVSHSLAMIAWNCLYRRKVAHLHLVHGGTDEVLSYGRKRRLNGMAVRFVAVSQFVRDRLCAHGVAPRQISVVENFLSDSRVARMPRRAEFRDAGIRRAIVISRIDPIKRVDLLLDAIERRPELRRIQVRVFGTGWEFETLRDRARRCCPNVEFAGFSDRVDAELAAADLLIHLCPSEPFGLAILEAMAAGVPVLVPNRGGAGSLVDDGGNGFHFEADNPDSLAARLLSVEAGGPSLLNRAVAGGFASLNTRFSARERLQDYRRLIQEALA